MNRLLESVVNHKGRLCATVLLILSLSGCTRLFFYPMTPHVSTPSAFGYEYQDVFLRAADETPLHAWLIKPQGPPKGIVYFLHGNAENISTHFLATLWLVDAGYEVFALDYRGYGLSQGKPDLPEVFSDIAAGATWLRKQAVKRSMQTQPARVSRLPMYLYGQSLGASLAIKYVEQDTHFNQTFKALISEAAFSRYDDIAKHVASRHWLTWSAQYPAKWLIGNDYDPIDAIAQLGETPKLLIHSADDGIIPYRFGETLYAAAAEPKQWIQAQGAHIRAAAYPVVRQQILAFMQRFAHPEILQVRTPSGNRINQ